MWIKDVNGMTFIVVNNKQLKTPKVCLGIHIWYFEDFTRMRNTDYKLIILDEVAQY